MDAFFLSIWTWVNNPGHLLEIGVAGVALGQVATYLPAKFPYKQKIVNALHGIFPSPQVFVNGATTEIANIEKVAPLVENLLELLEAQNPAGAAKTTPAPPPAIGSDKDDKDITKP